MEKGLINNLVPVKTKDGRIWYIDISNLNLSELIKLRKELVGKSVTSIRVLDAIIHENSNTTFKETNFRKREFAEKKSGYRNRKILIKMKRKGR